MPAPETLFTFGFVLGFVLIFLVVGLGILISNWPRPDTRKDASNPSVTEMVMRDEGDAL